MPTAVEFTSAIPFKRTERRIYYPQAERTPDVVKHICLFDISNDLLADEAKSLPYHARHKCAQIGQRSEIHLVNQL